MENKKLVHLILNEVKSHNGKEAKAAQVYLEENLPYLEKLEDSTVQTLFGLIGVRKKAEAADILNILNTNDPDKLLDDLGKTGGKFITSNQVAQAAAQKNRELVEQLGVSAARLISSAILAAL